MYGFKNSYRTKAFPISQVQTIQIMNSSDTGWNLAPPHIDYIVNSLKNYKIQNRTILLKMEYEFYRKVNLILSLKIRSRVR